MRFLKGALKSQVATAALQCLPDGAGLQKSFSQASYSFPPLRGFDWLLPMQLNEMVLRLWGLNQYHLEFDSLVLVYSLRIVIANNFSSDANGPWTTLGELLAQEFMA